MPSISRIDFGDVVEAITPLVNQRSGNIIPGVFTRAFIHHLVQTAVRSTHAARESERIHMAETGVERTGKRLTARDQGPPSSSSIAIILLIVRFRFFLDKSFHNVFDIPDFDQNIFGFEIGMDDATFAMEIIQSQQDLFGDLLHQGHGYPTMIPSLDQTEQILSQDLKHHADVHPVRSLVLERIQQADNVFLARVIGIRLDNLV